MPPKATTETAEDRREAIVTAVRDVLNEFGIRRATVGDVARAAGVSRQTVYDYFPSREALVAAALDAGARDLVARGVADADARGGSAAERLELLLRVGLEFAATSALWATPAKRAELVDHVTIDGQVFRTAATAAIAEALARWWPQTDAGRVERVARMLARLLVSHGLAPEEGEPDAVAAELAAVLAAGLEC